MTENLIQYDIATILDSLDGEVSTASRVVDSMLDLRLVGADNDLFVMVLDNALATMPGRTAVPNDWIRKTMEDLRGALGSAEAPAPAPS